jgi:hypothetical protein
MSTFQGFIAPERPRGSKSLRYIRDGVRAEWHAEEERLSATSGLNVYQAYRNGSLTIKHETRVEATCHDNDFEKATVEVKMEGRAPICIVHSLPTH